MRKAWRCAVLALGGDGQVADEAAAELVRRYAQPHRRYHNLVHVEAVVRDATGLAHRLGLAEVERALLVVAACAHDVVYDGRPGEDEQRSADWVEHWLTRARVAAVHAARAAELVLATAAHTAPAGDLTALALLDADLAILAAEEAGYDEYRAAVRQEYSAYDEAAWRAGRTKVLTELVSREPLYATEAGRQLWEAAAKSNLARELRSLAAQDR
ncbi:hypothetical protein [Kutzneria albida]|uniref:HD domain-containing protein n=1 Tax=Kutzneria albida TaxID=43357 RepID=UPI00046D59F7|nr:hypothetical protein [Kutzneria albida]